MFIEIEFVIFWWLRADEDGLERIDNMKKYDEDRNNKLLGW
jgi:hypothetical protein